MSGCILLQSEPKDKNKFLNLINSQKNKKILCLSFEARSFLEDNNIQYEDTLKFFKNNDHKLCLRLSNNIKKKLRNNINKLNCELKKYNSFKVWFSNYIVFKFINHKLFLYIVLKNFFKINKFETIDSFGLNHFLPSDFFQKKLKIKNIDIFYHDCKSQNIKTKFIQKIIKRINMFFIQIYNSFVKIDFNDSSLYFTSMYNVLDYETLKKKFLIQTQEINFLKVLKLLFSGIKTKFYINKDKIFVKKNEIKIFLKNEMSIFYFFFNKDTKYVINDIYKNINSFSNILEYFNKDITRCNNINFISPFSFGISGILGELINKNGEMSLCIPHGTCAPIKNNSYDYLSNYEIGESILINDFSHVLIQSDMSNQSADLFKISSKKKYSSPITFYPQNNRYIDNKTFLHASTFKNFENFKFYLVETFDEYLISLKDICDLFYNLKYKLIIQPHPSLKEHISLESLKNFLNIKSKNIIINDDTFQKNSNISNVLISYSSTTIEEFLLSRKPVILYDKWKRYNHCINYIDKKNNTINYFNNSSDINKSIDEIYNSSLKQNRYFDKYSLKVNN